MAVFKLVISEPSSRKSFQMEVEQEKAVALVGKKIGDEFNGDGLGLDGYTLKITGGTDKDGFPMHPSLKGPGRKKLLLTGRPGYIPGQKGRRRRKMVRGDTVSNDIVQINVKVTKVGEKPFDQLSPKKEEAKKEEAAPAEKAPEPKQEEPKPAEKPKKPEKKEEPKKEEPKPEEKPAESTQEAKPEPKPEKKAEEKAAEPKPE
jgi:small subunit ribosomal protein S6e